MFGRKTLIAIRCMSYTEDVKNVAKSMQFFFPDSDIIFASDQRMKHHEFPDGTDVIPMTNDKLDALGLFRSRENVGWICGDYCYYVALEREWDYLWLVEPDVAFGGDAATVMRRAEATEVGLIGTNIGVRPEGWKWATWLRASSDFDEARGVFFPLTRVSRRLAEAALNERQKMTATLAADTTLRVPNDESVIASTALRLGLPSLDLKALHPEAFSQWSWRTRICVDEIAHSIQPKFTHPAHRRSEFVSKVSADLAKQLADSTLRSSLSGLSAGLSADVLQAAVRHAGR